MKALIEEVKTQFIDRFRHNPQVYSQSPGRINILGEHTDYTGGVSLPAAIDCWTVAAWRQRTDHQIRIHTTSLSDSWETSWADLEKPLDQQWKKYVAGSALLFKENQLSQENPSGFELVLTGNIPLGKGLSSSAAVELTVLNGLNTLYKKDLSPLAMTQMAQQVEHRFLKVKSGLLDQFACQFSQAGHALLIDFRTLKAQSVVMGAAFAQMAWLLVDSQVKRELASSKYSERVDEYHTILKILADGGHPGLRDLPLSEVDHVFAGHGANILKRARHIVSENARTLKAVECLKAGDPENLGRLMNLTHESLANDYEVSHPNLDHMVRFAKSVEGVYGGRMMGGGFGGCGLFLVKRSHAKSAGDKIAHDYLEKFNVKTDPRSYVFVDGASAWTENGG